MNQSVLFNQSLNPNSFQSQTLPVDQQQEAPNPQQTQLSSPQQSSPALKIQNPQIMQQVQQPQNAQNAQLPPPLQSQIINPQPTPQSPGQQSQLPPPLQSQTLNPQQLQQPQLPPPLQSQIIQLSHAQQTIPNAQTLQPLSPEQQSQLPPPLQSQIISQPVQDAHSQSSHKSRHKKTHRKTERHFLHERIIDLSNYTPIRQLGKGSFGEVVLVRENSTGELYAAKLLFSDIVRSIDQVQFLREVELLMCANHPAVLRLQGLTLKASTDNPYPMIMTQYLPNGSLEDYIFQKKLNDITLKMIILYGIAKAMSYIHVKLGIVHRDLKPANVLMNSNDEPVVCDFGFSKLMNNEYENMKQSKVVGSPVYMAPELLKGEEYNSSTDVYSYGILMCEVISGVPAYEDVRTMGELVMKVSQGVRPNIPGNVPKEFVGLMESCWNEFPENRPRFRDVSSFIRTNASLFPGVDMNAFGNYVKKIRENRNDSS
ncbi:TKL family protein kinase [Histomonas meleagridis]|uniref:TKL family protein kinase n=1 Tax=Histomonas meleagridis TaxID=135588 RepID=UPI0035595943|nr:TKL family protein kinase [Histomonas meleagridis]KAH0806165.1 TKL family protein kinase [Histomonas meleagridis]